MNEKFPSLIVICCIIGMFVCLQLNSCIDLSECTKCIECPKVKENKDVNCIDYGDGRLEKFIFDNEYKYMFYVDSGEIRVGGNLTFYSHQSITTVHAQRKIGGKYKGDGKDVSKHYLEDGKDWEYDKHFNISFRYYKEPNYGDSNYKKIKQGIYFKYHDKPIIKQPEPIIKEVIKEVIVEKEVVVEKIIKEKEETNMFSFLQIFVIFLIALTVVKVGHLITRKLFFKYVKKEVAKVKEDWKTCDDQE